MYHILFTNDCVVIDPSCHASRCVGGSCSEWWHHQAVITHSDRSVPAPGGHWSPGGTAPIAHPLATLPTMVHTQTLLCSPMAGTGHSCCANTLITHGAMSYLTIWHPVVWPGAVLDHVDGKLQGGGQATHCSVHRLPHLADLDLVRFQVGTRGLQDSIISGRVTWLAHPHGLVTPASVGNRSLII